MLGIMHFSLFLTAAIVLACPMAAAGQKFKNKDTAKNRSNYTWGTSAGQTGGNATFSKDAQGDTVIHADPGPKKEEVDWYDKVIITVDPDVSWPRDDNGTTP